MKKETPYRANCDLDFGESFRSEFKGKKLGMSLLKMYFHLA